jgi:hypothetical protein
MSFPGQKEFEDRFRARFRKLWLMTQEIVRVLGRINVPRNAEFAAPLIGPAPSILSGFDMPEGDDNESEDEDMDMDTPAIA